MKVKELYLPANRILNESCCFLFFAIYTSSIMNERSGYMFLLTILAIIFVLFVVIAAIILGIGGTAFLMTFADVIVCIVIIALIIKFVGKKK